MLRYKIIAWELRRTMFSYISNLSVIICFGKKSQQKYAEEKVGLPIHFPFWINLILCSNISSCKSLLYLFHSFFGVLSLSHTMLIIKANGLLKDNALSKISLLFVKGGFDTMQSQCSFGS